MRKNIRLTESDITRIVRKVINEQDPKILPDEELVSELETYGFVETENPNIFKRTQYVSIYDTSVSSVCLGDTNTENFSYGADNIKGAIERSKALSTETRCKKRL
jgi:hypothetical protein